MGQAMRRTLIVSFGVLFATACWACSKDDAKQAELEAAKGKVATAEAEKVKAEAEKAKAEAEAAKAEAEAAKAKAEAEAEKVKAPPPEPAKPVLPLKVTSKFDADRPVVGDDTAWITCRIVNDNAESHAVHVVGTYTSDNNPTLTGATDVTVPGGSMRDAKISFGKIDLGRSKNPRAGCTVTASDGTPIRNL